MITASEPINLEKVVAATCQGEGFMYLSTTQYRNLLKEGYVEVNEEMTNGLTGLAKKVAVRATEKGISEIYPIKAEFVSPTTEDEKTPSISETINTNTMSEAIETKAIKPAFELLTETEVPIIVRATEREAKYPFDLLNPVPEPGNAFFVPATEDMPNPEKSLQSSLTNANKKYAEPTGATRTNRKGNEVAETVQTRKFVMRKVEGGVKIIRTK
jgi:hypothetical protein